LESGFSKVFQQLQPKKIINVCFEMVYTVSWETRDTGTCAFRGFRIVFFEAKQVFYRFVLRVSPSLKIFSWIPIFSTIFKNL